MKKIKTLSYYKFVIFKKLNKFLYFDKM